MCLKQLRASHRAPRLAALAIECLAQLLSSTMTTPARNPTNATDEDALALLRNLSVMAQSQSPENEQPRPELDNFSMEINARLPAPLNVLLNLIQASPSPKVRASAAPLCRAILAETRAVWTKQNWLMVEKNTLQCCLSLSQDDNLGKPNEAKN